MSAWWKYLALPVVVAGAVTLGSARPAQAQVYGYYSSPGYAYPAPYGYYGAPYGAYYPPAYGYGYYPRPTIGLSFGFPLGGFYGGYRGYYGGYHHHGHRW